ncbi:MAG: hypothetical protein FWC68_06015, partial [Oscillospiraceae bacterium]|nr:hypothetical protein [Oscillospiraceae bacterium]
MIQMYWGEFPGVVGLDLTGIIDYRIANFDNTGRDKLLVVRMASSTNEFNHITNTLYAYMYEFIDGIALRIDRHVLMSGILQATIEEYTDVFIKNVNGRYLIVVENQAEFGLFSNGIRWSSRILSYVNGRFYEVVYAYFEAMHLYYEKEYAQVQRKFYEHGIVINPWDFNLLSNFDDGVTFTRMARHNTGIDVICSIKISHEIIWEHVRDFWETNIIPPTPPIKINITNSPWGYLGDQAGSEDLPIPPRPVIPRDFNPIYTAEDLANIMSGGISRTRYYILMNDIDLSTWGNWEPILRFRNGVLDGNGYRILNLNINKVDARNGVGLFAETFDVEIRNLGVYGTIHVDTSSHAFVGGIVGRCSFRNTRIINSYNATNITLVMNDAFWIPAGNSIGGIIGYGGEEVVNSYNIGILTVINNSRATVNKGEIYGWGLRLVR